MGIASDVFQGCEVAIQAVEVRSKLLEKASQRLERSQREFRKAKIDLDHAMSQLTQALQKTSVLLVQVDEESAIPEAYEDQIAWLSQERGTLFERSDICKSIVEGGVSPKDMAKLINVSHRYVKKMMAIAEYRQKLRLLINRNVISATYASDLTARIGEDACVALIEEIVGYLQKRPKGNQRLRSGENLITESVVDDYQSRMSRSGARPVSSEASRALGGFK